MKYTTRALILFGFLFITKSLSSQTKPLLLKVDLECREAPNLLSVFDLVSYVKLETSESILLKQISRLNYINDSLYIYSGGYCYLFSCNGKYLNRIGKRGRGPGEMVAPFDCSVIDGIPEIALIDNRLSRISLYNKYGNYIVNKSPGIDYIGHLERISQDEFIITTYIKQKTEKTSMPDDFNNSCAYYFNIKSKEVKGIVKFPDNPAVIKVENWNSFYKYNSNTYFRPPFSCKIYKYHGRDLMENVISVDFGKYTLDEEDRSYEDKPERILIESNKGKVVLLYAFVEMKDLYSLIYLKGGDFYLHLISKETGKQVRYNVKNQLDVLGYCLPLYAYGDLIMGSLEPSRFITSFKNLDYYDKNIEEQKVLNEIRKDLLPEDNPVILFLRPKL